MICTTKAFEYELGSVASQIVAQNRYKNLHTSTVTVPEERYLWV